MAELPQLRLIGVEVDTAAVCGPDGCVPTGPADEATDPAGATDPAAPTGATSPAGATAPTD